MRAIILAAGEGTRLRPYTLDRPKCLVELGGKPLLVRQVDILRTVGIGNITVLTGYRADQIEACYHRDVDASQGQIPVGAEGCESRGSRIVGPA